MMNKLKQEIEALTEEPLVGLDIETITVQVGDKWSIKPFEIGFYAPKSNRGITIYVNPYYWINISRIEKAMFFYPREKYREGEGFVINEETAINLLKDLRLKTIYGHNCLKFDLPHLHANGMTIRAQKIVDTFLESGEALPLKYYTTLLNWHNELMEELSQIEKPLNKDEKKKYFKFFTEKGNLKMTAESIFCFISGDKNFIETHIALHDAMVEYEIFKYIAKRKPVGKITNGNWMTNLLNFFSKFKRTKELAENIEKMLEKFPPNDNSYTDKLIQQFLVG